MIRNPASQRWMGGMLSALAALLFAGCAELINPYQDDLPSTRRIGTASSRHVREAAGESPLVRRDWSERETRAQDAGVTHWPLWWSDWMEDSGSDDGTFAWTWLDYFGIVYGPARQTVNTVGVPLSMAVALPGTLYCSDGRISTQAFGGSHHDLVTCRGVPIPPDIIEAYHDPAEPRAPQP